MTRDQKLHFCFYLLQTVITVIVTKQSNPHCTGIHSNIFQPLEGLTSVTLNTSLNRLNQCKCRAMPWPVYHIFAYLMQFLLWTCFHVVWIPVCGFMGSSPWYGMSVGQTLCPITAAVILCYILCYSVIVTGRLHFPGRPCGTNEAKMTHGRWGYVLLKGWDCSYNCWRVCVNSILGGSGLVLNQ